MPVRRVVANEQVEADRDRVALQRGPIVYAAEWPDNPSGRVRNLVLPTSAALAVRVPGRLLDGVAVVTGAGRGVRDVDSTAASRATTAVHRDPVSRGPTAAGRDGGLAGRAAATSATAAAIPDARHAQHGDDLAEPPLPGLHQRRRRARRRPTTRRSYFDWWPTKGTTEWVEMHCPRSRDRVGSRVYWFDDTGRGQVRVPASWPLLYKDGDTWRPVQDATPFGTARDRPNVVTFAPVRTAALRLDITSAARLLGRDTGVDSSVTPNA